MKRLFVACIVIVLLSTLVVAPSISAQGASPGVGFADLVQVGSSGIEGQLRFTDTGMALRTYSSAPVSGFNPTQTYVTLVYGLTSRGPGEALPICGRDTTLGFDEMFIGAWTPAASGTRMLDATKPHTIFIQILGTTIANQAPGGVRLNEARTVSIRQFNPPPGTNPPTNPGTLTSLLLAWATGDIPPQTFQLRSCGFIMPGNPPA
jgi:hypothetical protein